MQSNAMRFNAHIIAHVVVRLNSVVRFWLLLQRFCGLRLVKFALDMIKHGTLHLNWDEIVNSSPNEKCITQTRMSHTCTRTCTRVYTNIFERRKNASNQRNVLLLQRCIQSVRERVKTVFLAIVASWLDELAQAGTFYHMEQFAQVYFWLLKITIDITR